MYKNFRKRSLALLMALAILSQFICQISLPVWADNELDLVDEPVTIKFPAEEEQQTPGPDPKPNQLPVLEPSPAPPFLEPNPDPDTIPDPDLVPQLDPKADPVVDPLADPAPDAVPQSNISPLNSSEGSDKESTGPESENSDEENTDAETAVLTPLEDASPYIAPPLGLSWVSAAAYPLEEKQFVQEVSAEDPCEEASEILEMAPAPVFAPVGQAPVISDPGVYLNGQSGDDSRDGLREDRAVQSLAKAIAVAQEKQLKVIYITGTVSIGTSSGEVVSWPAGTIARHAQFQGSLFDIASGNTATLANIVLDGNAGAVAPNAPTESLVTCQGTLNIQEGAVLRNNSALAANNGLAFGGAIFCKAGVVNMTGGEIKDNKANFGGGIALMSHSACNVSGGTIANNKVLHPVYFSIGGGILADTSELAITGGTIQHNMANNGAGVALMSADFRMSGGSIQENNFLNGDIGCGGGVYGQNAQLTIEGGMVCGNTSDFGGGIAVYEGSLTLIEGQILNNACPRTLRVKDKNDDVDNDNGRRNGGGGIYCENTKLSILSGTISENKSESLGGGLYVLNTVDSGLSEYENTITGGMFTGNIATDFWGGGAIYVDTYVTLRINNALVTQNSVRNPYMFGVGGVGIDKPASCQGGGIWCCPTGRTTMHITKGLALFENKVPDSGPNKSYKGAGDDLASVSKRKYDNVLAQPINSVTLASRMLGGGKRLWYQDGSTQGVHVNRPTGSQEPRCNPANPGEALPYNQLLEDSVDRSLTFKSLPSEEAKNLARQVATVIIADNHSEFTGISGGGISCNGHLIFGEPGVYELVVKKVWEDDSPSDRPLELQLELYVGEHHIDDLVLTEANNWEARLTEFPDPATLIDASTGELLPITFREASGQPGIDKYVMTQTGPEIDEANKTYTFTLTNRIPSNPPEVSVPYEPRIRVEKVWQDDQNQAGLRPESVRVELLANGKPVGVSLTLEADKLWVGYIFEDLPAVDDQGNPISYNLRETPVAGYRSLVMGNIDKGFTVYNSLEPELPTSPNPQVYELPRTGQAAGLETYAFISLGLVVLGLLLKKRG